MPLCVKHYVKKLLNISFNSYMRGYNSSHFTHKEMQAERVQSFLQDCKDSEWWI